jgi:hypothetical protein|tara:strand:- start:79570 stop:80247 length:678 start_codon:yes stop_codon:yes gene_type:complete
MTIKSVILASSLLGIFLSGANLGYARDDIQWWQWLNLNLMEEGPHKIHLYLDNRIVEDVTEERLWLASIGYKYQASKRTQIGLGYTYLDIRNIAQDTWMHRQRLELEVSHETKLNASLKLHLRNRIEIWWDEDENTDEYRSRHRIQLSHPLSIGKLYKIYTNTEVFYNYERDLLSQVRTIPVGLGFKLSKATQLSIFYMIQSNRATNGMPWSHNHAIGTHLNHTF